MNCLARLFSYMLSILVLRRANSSPTIPFNSAKNYGVYSQQDFYSTLASIEERLLSIDQILIRQSNFNVGNQFAHIQRRLDNLESKMNHLESTMDEFHKNNNGVIGNVIKSELKVILGNKLDEQVAAENIISKLEKIEDELTSHNEETQAELSDIIGLVEDLKSPCYDKNDIFNNEVTEDSSVQQTEKNGTWNMNEYKKHYMEMDKFANWSSDFLLSLKTNLQQDLNDYANKVADMNSGFWEANEIIMKNLQTLEKSVNLTRSDLHNLVKKFMIQLNKRFQRNASSDFSSESTLDEMTQHMNSNFEKILSTQNLFLESCYKLQNDDSQMESRIENLLQIITDELETKSIIGLEEIRKITAIITNHDDTIKQYLRQDRKNYSMDSQSIRERQDSKTGLIKSDAMNFMPEFLQYANYTEIYVQKSVSGRAHILAQSKLVQENFVEKRRPNQHDSFDEETSQMEIPQSQRQPKLQDFNEEDSLKGNSSQMMHKPRNQAQAKLLHNLRKNMVNNMTIKKDNNMDNKSTKQKTMHTTETLDNSEKDKNTVVDSERSDHTSENVHNYKNNNEDEETYNWFDELFMNNTGKDESENNQINIDFVPNTEDYSYSAPQKQTETEDIIINIDNPETTKIAYSEDSQSNRMEDK